MHITPISNSLYIGKTFNAPAKNIQNSEYQAAPAYNTPSAPSFSGLMRIGKDFTKPVDSAFFRDYPALMSTVNMLKENFPDGAEILDYACSDGEEAISLYALLGDDREKYKITGIDINDDPIKLANKGVYSLFGGYLDSYLMPGAKKDPTEKELSRMFFEIMEPTDEPSEPLNNSPEFIMTLCGAKPKFRKQLFYKVKDEVKNNLEFKTGDIFKMDEEASNKKVGAILFRNAFYHLMDNHDGEELLLGDTKPFSELDEEFFDEEKGESLYEKQAIADKIIDKVYDKLEIGGVFVLGNSINESIFLADENTPVEDTIRFGDTKAYQKRADGLRKSIDNFFVRADARFIPIVQTGGKLTMMALESLEDSADLRILKKTPMQTALERNGRFKPVYASEIQSMEGIETPTVWVKVK